MKRWILTTLAAFSLLGLALTAKIWVPWILLFAIRNKETVDSVKDFIELVSKLLAWVGAIFLPLHQLWRQKKGPAEKLPVVNVQVINQPPVSVPASAPVFAALHQLPPPPADFTGREEDLKELRAAILVGGVHISGLQGQGGVGKTALALKLAADLAPNFHDAQIYLDLKGISERPLTSSEAMKHVLRTFHPEVKLPNKEDELSALYHTVLHDKRVLLLMDNAKDAAQLKSLIPPQGCALLVTSRYRFALPGLQQKNLDTLLPEDATKLLLRIAPVIGCEAEAIARSCGYLALALRLAATAIAEHINLAPSDYRQKLSDEKQRLKLLSGDGGVEASITLSYNLLDGESQKHWRVLAVFPDTFDASAPAAIWGIGAAAANEALSRFLQYSMLQWNESTKRYRLHDLMRDFARRQLTQLTATESHDAFRDHARHYGEILEKSDQLYLRGGDSIMRGLTLFDLEWGNIQAGQAWAAASAATDQEAAKLCSSFPDWGIRVLDLRRHQGEQIHWREAALAAARKLKDRAAEGRHLGNVGVAYADSGEYRRAIDYQEQALVIARDIGDKRGEGTALGQLGNTYYSLGEYSRAIDYQEKALVIARDVGDKRGEGNALGTLGVAYADTGEFHRAIEYQEQRQAIARIMGDQQAEAQALGNLGIAHRSLGDHQRAIKDHEGSLKINHALGNLWEEGRDLSNLGYTYAELRDARRAIDYYEKALAIARAVGDLRNEGNTLGIMSLAVDKIGDRKRAIEHAEASLKIREKIEDPNAATVRKQLEEWRNV
jgi:tetratricopeptide (TPR) repeat protein